MSNDFDYWKNEGIAKLVEEANLSSYPGIPHKREIIICGGGPVHGLGAWVAVNMIRWLGCKTQITVFRFEDEWLPDFSSIPDVRVVSIKRSSIDGGGWHLKAFACDFMMSETTLYLDADNVPCQNLDTVFEWFEKSEFDFWGFPDMWKWHGDEPFLDMIWMNGFSGPRLETGQFFFKRSKCEKAIRMWRLLCDNWRFFFQYSLGDTDLLWFSIYRFNLGTELVDEDWDYVPGTIRHCTRVMTGDWMPLFQHRSTAKWRMEYVKGTDRRWRSQGFLYEDKCYEFLDQLKGTNLPA